MAYNKRSYETKLDEAEQAQRAELAILVDAYEAVRRSPCRARDKAERELEIALSQYDQTFVHSGYAWSWSWAQESILRQPMFIFHARPKVRS